MQSFQVNNKYILVLILLLLAILGHTQTIKKQKVKGIVIFTYVKHPLDNDSTSYFYYECGTYIQYNKYFRNKRYFFCTDISPHIFIVKKYPIIIDGYVVEKIKRNYADTLYGYINRNPFHDVDIRSEISVVNSTEMYERLHKKDSLMIAFQIKASVFTYKNSLYLAEIWKESNLFYQETLANCPNCLKAYTKPVTSFMLLSQLYKMRRLTARQIRNLGLIKSSKTRIISAN